jgi:dihydrofolate synthase/folylpolyglutamate synthase
MKIANFAEAHERLRQFYNASQEYKLDTMRQFMSYLGNPQNSLRVIHVAGTSGKTSTCYYAAALLRAAGYKVGLTVSPHVDEVNERVQIDLQPLPEAEFCAALGEFMDLVAGSNLPLSYFEVMVAFAYWYFAKESVDYAVVEVGLGGRIDGTNIIDRQDKICVITNIGLDHTRVLGASLTQIAAEKAGIITTGNDVFVCDQAEDIIEVCAGRCVAVGATMHVVTAERSAALAELPLFQQRNFQLAAAAVREVMKREHKMLNKLSVKEAATAYIPARMEIVELGSKTIILDGAHNGQKLHALTESIAERYPDQPVAAMVAFVRGDDQRIQGALDELLPHLSYCIVTEFAGEQDVPKTSVAAEDVAVLLEERGFTDYAVAPNPETALEQLLQRPERILLVAGSFYLLNHVRPGLLQL